MDMRVGSSVLRLSADSWVGSGMPAGRRRFPIIGGYRLCSVSMVQGLYE